MSCWDCVFNAGLYQIAEEYGLSIGRVPLSGNDEYNREQEFIYGKDKPREKKK